MEGIADEVLADLALDEGLDCWDLAVIQHILQQEEERIELDRGFDLQQVTPQQLGDYFRLSPEEIMHLCQLLHMPGKMAEVNRTSTSGKT